jgi:hypothetical protein
MRAGTRMGAYVLRTEKQSGPKHRDDSRAYKMHLVNTSSARIQYPRAVPADGEREPGSRNLAKENGFAIKKYFEKRPPAVLWALPSK